MKAVIKILTPHIMLAALLVLGLFSALVFGQKNVKAAKKQERDRALVVSGFKQKKVDGLEVKLLDASGNPTDPGRSFKTGDRVRISLASNFDGYVYFINVDPKGGTRVFWHTRVEADRDNVLPQGSEAIEFTGNDKGTEIFKVVMSPEKISLYEDAIRNANGELGKTAEMAAAELSDTPKDNKDKGKKGKDNKDKNAKEKPAKAPGEAVGIVQPQGEGGTRCRGLGFDSDPNIRCRGLSFASGDTTKKEGTVVAISDKQGKLKSGDVAVFELRLKHI